MFLNELLNLIKRNIFTIVIIVTLLVAMPWLGYLFVIPLVVVILFGLILAWKVHQLRSQIYKESERQQQTQQGWWQRTHNRTHNEGEVTVVHTEQPEQRVSDDVGEYVDFKEIKEDKTK